MGGAYAPIGWSAYVRNLPNLLLFCLILGVITTKIYSVWEKYIDRLNSNDTKK